MRTQQLSVLLTVGQSPRTDKRHISTGTRGVGKKDFSCRNAPVVPAWQLVHTTSFVRGTMAQLELPGHGQGWQSEAVPTVASP